MILAWLNAHEATEIGVALADEFAPPTKSAVAGNTSGSTERLLLRVDREVRLLDREVE